MKKMFFVMNPYAGMRKANRYLPEIISIFNRGGYDVTVHMTEDQGDAAKAVARLAPEMDLVVCCGGDGTFNETVSGLLESGVDIPVGYIPAGSTNDFANSLHLPDNILEAARRSSAVSLWPMTWAALVDAVFLMWRPLAHLPGPAMQHPKM